MFLLFLTSLFGSVVVAERAEFIFIRVLVASIVVVVVYLTLLFLIILWEVHLDDDRKEDKEATIDVKGVSVA